MKKILIIFGTRPEAIKLAPLYHEIVRSNKFKPYICSTGQHKEMLMQAMEYFGLSADYNLDVMKYNQGLGDLTALILSGLSKIVQDCKPDLIVVQGDTTTTFVGGLVAYYNRIKLVHIEAGLRSHSKYSPYPEEMNRILTTHLSDYHFAPTERTAENLRQEGVAAEKIFVVGNTVIDALFMGLERLKTYDSDELNNRLGMIDFSKEVILVTGHRRESFGKPLKEICKALSAIATDDRVQIVYPVHLNPNVRKPVFSMLNKRKNIHLIDPLDYPVMIYLMSRSTIILTDSGGIQEEAPALKKPVLVMRDVTERAEGIDAKVTKLVGTSSEMIIKETLNLLNNQDAYNIMASGKNPYGDGFASKRIVEILERDL